MFPLLFHDKFLSGSGRVDQIPIRIRQKGSDPTGSGFGSATLIVITVALIFGVLGVKYEVLGFIGVF